jgi:hypothetical protein
MQADGDFTLSFTGTNLKAGEVPVTQQRTHRLIDSALIRPRLWRRLRLEGANSAGWAWCASHARSMAAVIVGHHVFSTISLNRKDGAS